MSDLLTKWEKAARILRARRKTSRAISCARRGGRTGKALLVTNLAQMGDVVLCAGVAAALHEKYPTSPLVFAAQPQWLPLLEGDSSIDGIIGLRSLFEVRSLARTGLYGTVYILDIPIPNLLHYFDGTQCIFRYSEPTTGEWYTHGTHLMALYEQNAGLATGSARPRIWIRPEDEAFVDDTLARLRNRPGLRIALHTRSSEEAKNWPMKKFGDLVSRIHTKHGARFVVVGGPGEGTALAAHPAVENFAGRLSVKQTAALINKCDLFIGLDSGLAYVAEAVNTPGVVLLGPTIPETSGPRDHSRFRFVRDAQACSPACHRACTCSPFCIEHLSVDQVEAAVSDLLTQLPALEKPCPSP